MKSEDPLVNGVDLQDAVTTSLGPGATLATGYASDVVELLLGLLTEVVAARAPDVLPHLRDNTSPPVDDRDNLLRCLQVQGIWFQLLNIAEENAAMRLRRDHENQVGRSELRGTFAHVLAMAANAGVSAARLQEFFNSAQIRPTITAHPTETRRITALEIHRRIYRRLVDLESDRWTERERTRLVDSLRNEIDLLWLTGELLLEKPTVEKEVGWGLHFFRGTIFGLIPEVQDSLAWALQQHYPDTHFSLPPFFQFGSWIGGDRDGNPFVTHEVTLKTLQTNARAAIQHYRDHLRGLRNTLSATRNAAAVRPLFLQNLDRLLGECSAGQEIVLRNPGEVFRQFIACAMSKLDANLALIDGQTAKDTAYKNADELIGDLRSLEEGMNSAQCSDLTSAYVTPIRREVQAFRFRTVRLDLRQNTTVTNRTL